MSEYRRERTSAGHHCGSLRWQEKDGSPVTPATRKGFGSRVIERGLPHELQGTVNLDYRVDGVVCTINIPAPRGPRDE
jgi:two-component sensor histidine kinase